MLIPSSLLIALTIGPREIVPVLAAVAIGGFAWFILSLRSGGDGKASERLDRFKKVKSTAEVARQVTSDRLQDLLEKAAPALAKPLQPQNEQEQSALRIRLSNGGWRSESAASVYLGLRFASLMVGLVIAGTVLLPAYGFTRNGIIITVSTVGFFFYLPAIVVWWRVSKRKEQIFFGLPDALDLMVVCVEAGLGLDAAMRKVCEEMGMTYPIISEEFSICNFQLQMGRPRREVLHDLGIRTGVDDMKSLAAILIQADRFGSSIAQALRVQSDSMRVRRKQQAEERAAKTAVQLLIPLVLFIFPAIFVVLVGPAAIQIMDNLIKK